MKNYLTIALSIVALAAFFRCVQAEAIEKEPAMSGWLAHDVYFSLKDNSSQAKEKLIAACKKYLADHPGAVSFTVGPRVEEIKRDANDRDFDVAMHLVFKSKAAHDQYATSERHLKFIAENKDTWRKVRVFDSYVE